MSEENDGECSEAYRNEEAEMHKQWLASKSAMAREEEYPCEPRDSSELVDKHELNTEKD